MKNALGMYKNEVNGMWVLARITYDSDTKKFSFSGKILPKSQQMLEGFGGGLPIPGAEGEPLPEPGIGGPQGPLSRAENEMGRNLGAERLPTV